MKVERLVARSGAQPAPDEVQGGPAAAELAGASAVGFAVQQAAEPGETPAPPEVTLAPGEVARQESAEAQSEPAAQRRLLPGEVGA